MIIKELKLRNFRNIDSCHLLFDEGCTVLLGENAQGKTNILESLVFLSTTRSHRLQFDQQMIQEGKDLCNIECTLFDDKDVKIGAVIYPKGKTLFINQKPIPKSSDFIGKLNVVLFSPTDMEIFDDSPKERRRVIDIEIGKSSFHYMYHLSRYNKLLKDRNNLLKMNRIDDYISVLENQMIESATEICIERNEFFILCNQYLSKFYNFISSSNSKLEIKYLSSVEVQSKSQIREDLMQLMEKNRERDIIYKMTTSGIHRDDYIFEIDGKRAELFCSQGQKRMIVLALKFALIEYIKNKENRCPVLLLDDVLSELDSQKRMNLFKCIDNDIQTIITTTEICEGFDQLKRLPKIIEVANGKTQTKEVLK